jgi:hypothetical protein
LAKKFYPLNVHQTGPNESFWGFLTQKVSEEGWEAKTEQRLIYCTESNMKVFDEHFVESLLEGVKEKVKWTNEDGVYFFSK